MNIKKIGLLALFALAPVVLGGISSLFAGDMGAIYESIETPPFSPPGSLFGIAWTILYLLMGIASFLVFTSDAPRQDKNRALILYVVQLAVNLVWSPIFFAADAFWFASVVIILIDVLVAATIFFFLRVNKIAAIMLVPYLLWVLFATYLSIGCAILN